MKLITYGLGNVLNTEKIQPIKNRGFVKPEGGLWASPVDSLYGWREWCNDNNFGDLSTSFQFQFSGNIYTINSLNDLFSLPLRFAFENRFYFIDFEECLKRGIDAIHLTNSGEMATRFSKPVNLYGWDCESVLILNPNGITV